MLAALIITADTCVAGRPSWLPSEGGEQALAPPASASKELRYSGSVCGLPFSPETP